MNSKQLKEIFYNTTRGRDILKCIQCGTCSGSCPFTDRMDHGPREIFAMICDGEMKEALSSNTPWFCSSCYQCMARCPKEIPVTDIMYVLKELAGKHQLSPQPLKIADLYHSFINVVAMNGRITESLLMARYGLKHPLDALKNTPMALTLMKKRRLDLKFQKVKNKQSLTLPSEDKEGGR